MKSHNPPGRDLDAIACVRVAPWAAMLLFDIPFSETRDLDLFANFELRFFGFEDDLHQPLGLLCRKVGLLSDDLYEPVLG
jgi:hypothetical protein